MEIFECILLFIRAIQQCIWDLHLASLNEFIKYFFVHDFQNYSRYALVYLFDMYRQQEKDPDFWQFFSSANFSVNKTKILYSAIGADHALQQDNRKMIVLGGIEGIGNNQAAQDQYFLGRILLQLSTEP